MRKPKLLVNAIEAAERLGVCEKTVWSNTAPHGKCIPCVRLGDRVLYSPAGLEAWIEAQSKPPDVGVCDLPAGWCRIDYDMKQGLPFEFDLGALTKLLAQKECK